MILVISGADFTQDNIGNIPLIRELTNEVKAILANYTRPLTDDQKIAFQTFYYGLKNNGIWDKIQNLFCPALAANVTEAFYPIKGGGIVDEYSKTYSLYNHGLMVATDLDSNTPAKADLTGSVLDVHLVSYLSYVDTDFANEIYIDGAAGSTSGHNFRMSKYGKLGFVRIGGDGSAYFGEAAPSLPYNQGNKAFFVGVTSSSSAVMFCGDGEKLSGSTSPFSDDLTFTNGKLVIGANVNNSSRNAFAQALISSGAALTEAQIIKYNELTDALMAELL